MTLLGAAEVAELKTESPLTTTTTMVNKSPWLSVAALEIVSDVLFVKITSNQSKVRYKNPAFLMVIAKPLVYICFSKTKKETIVFLKYRNGS
jgi:hypothetical protein